MANPRANQIDCRETGDLGGMLRCFRERRGWSQRDLFEKSDISVNAISDIERGNRTSLHPSTVRMLADALALSPEDHAAFRARALGRIPTRKPTLPLPATSFLGREEMVDEIRRLLDNHQGRLLTLTGSGGSGKSRLALRVAETTAASFADGAFFVDLASMTDPQLVPSAIAHSLGVLTPGGRPVDQAVIEHCAARQLLLVLDNFERLLPAADYVNRLLAECPRVVALVTSREPLGLTRERLFPVAAMMLPNPRVDADLATVSRSEAVQLFVERAAAVRPAFRLTTENAADLAALCIGLDGLPLAIELAAAQLAFVSPATLRARMNRRLPWLKSGLRDQAARHRTMRDAIAWSYEILDPADQATFRRLAVFAGGFTVEAAEAILRGEQTAEQRADAEHGEAVFDRIVSLVRKNLVQLYDSRDGGTRYRMLETIREYGCEQLVAAGEEDSIRYRHAAWCADSLLRAEPDLWSGQQRGWVAWLEDDLDNLRLALDWWTSRGDPEEGLRLTAALVRFWSLRPVYLTEGRGWLERALAYGQSASAVVRARAMVGAGAIAKDHGLYDLAEGLLKTGIASARADGDIATLVRGLVNLGIALRYRGDLDRAEELLREALIVGKDNGERRFAAHAVDNLGVVAARRGATAQAVHYHDEALRLARADGDAWGSALALYRRGFALLDATDLAGAAGSFRESLALWSEHGDCWTLSECVEGIACLAAARRHWSTAARLFGAAEGLRAILGVPLVPDWQHFHADQSDVAARALGGSYATAVRAGREWTVDQILAEATAATTDGGVDADPAPHA